MNTTNHLIFLDFDGVVSKGMTARFQHAVRFSEWLRDHPNVRVVFSTAWRDSHTFEQLKSVFLEDVRHQFIGMTPTFMEMGYDLETTWMTHRGERAKEVLRWIHDNGYTGKFVAIDDTQWLFANDFDQIPEWVRLTDHKEGLQDKDFEFLSDWAKS